MAEPGHTLPDSLVIRPGEAYDRTNPAQAGGFFPLRATGEIKVYFGDDAKIVYTPENPRSPAYYQNYMLTQIGDRLYLATYTFTVADYEQALAAGAGI